MIKYRSLYFIPKYSKWQVPTSVPRIDYIQGFTNHYNIFSNTNQDVNHLAHAYHIDFAKRLPSHKFGFFLHIHKNYTIQIIDN